MNEAPRRQNLDHPNLAPTPPRPPSAERQSLDRPLDRRTLDRPS